MSTELSSPSLSSFVGGEEAEKIGKMNNAEAAAEDDVHGKTGASFDDLENSDASDSYYWDSETTTSDDEDDDDEDEDYYQGESSHFVISRTRSL